MEIARRKVGDVGGVQKLLSQKIPINLGSELRCEALHCHGLLDHGSLSSLYITDLGTSGKSFQRALMVKRLFSRIFASTEATISSVITATRAPIIMDVVAASFELSDPLTHFAFTHGSSSVNFPNLPVNVSSRQVSCRQKTHH
ncbi:hypothetical protein AVEN_94318-1 [Araneus ventricosus]|uniref:Uncharacterized protein n=1 Tax=Araneus ventricosus TaxID=182803 RepID=A0A4Y2DEM1_ARAVE|nr:hypothetical protein AVEN_94318-1 [Araneus ventricosus]